MVVSTDLKNISQNGNLPQVGVKIKNIWNHHLEEGLEETTGVGGETTRWFWRPGNILEMEIQQQKLRESYGEIWKT